MDNAFALPLGCVAGKPAPKAEEISWERLDRQDWHLWILAFLLMFVLGISLLTFMFPSAYWFSEELKLKAPQRAFLGFMVLLALALVYLMQRQAAMRRLKRQLFDAWAAVAEAERKANVQSFASLPGMGQFRDGLAMEYRRASHSGMRLAVFLLSVPNASREKMGQVTSILTRTLRRGETLARISDTTLAMILPGMCLSDANCFAVKTEEDLTAQLAGVEVILTVTAYPQEAASLAELEIPLRGLME